MDIIERDIYALICSSDGIKAKDIAKKLKKDRGVINHYLYASPYMHELCCRDREYNWHGYIRQVRPHKGLEDFCGYYSTVKEFLELGEDKWLEMLQAGCRRIYADDLYCYVPLQGTTAELPVCAGNMRFNVLDEYLGFLER